MSGIRAPDIKEQAEKDYISGMKYKDIAVKYDVSLNTVKSWKTRYKWNRNGVHTKKKVCTQKENKIKSMREPMHQEVEEVLNNTELTDKQRLFCVIYSRCLNATKAYKKSYNCSYETAMVNGSNLLRNTKINEQIEKLIGAQCNKEFLKESILQKYIDIAFADVTEYVTFGQEEYEIKDSEGNTQYNDDGTIKTGKYSYVRPNESNAVDGTLISEVSQGKDGIKIKLADKMKALDFLTKHCNLLNDEEKTKLQIENMRYQNTKLQAETEKIKGKDKDESINIVIKRKERED